MCSDLLDPHGTNQPQRHGLNSVQRQYLIKELRLLNASGSTKKIFLNSHHKNSSKDFVMFVQSTSDSVTEVNKAPKEQKGFTAGGVVATSGLHFHDQLTERYKCRKWSLLHPIQERIQEFFMVGWRGAGGGVGWSSYLDDHVFLNVWRPVAFLAGDTALRAGQTDHRRAPKNNYIFEYHWNLVWWQNATCVSLKKAAVKK